VLKARRRRKRLSTAGRATVHTIARSLTELFTPSRVSSLVHSRPSYGSHHRQVVDRVVHTIASELPRSQQAELRFTPSPGR